MTTAADATSRIRSARWRARLGGLMDDGWRILHLIVTLPPAWWCFALANDSPTFESSRAFRVLAELGTEAEFSMIAGFAAAFGFLGMAIPVRPFQVFAAGILAAWHGMIALALFASTGMHGTGTGIYAILAFGATLAMVDRTR